MQMIEPQENQIVIPINTKQGLDQLRELVDELEDGMVLSIDMEGLADGQKEE